MPLPRLLKERSASELDGRGQVCMALDQLSTSANGASEVLDMFRAPCCNETQFVAFRSHNYFVIGQNWSIWKIVDSSDTASDSSDDDVVIAVQGLPKTNVA